MNYWDYIRVEDLLDLQGGLDRDERNHSNDEVVFIVAHQVYELWFKLVLRELTTARDLFDQNPVPDMAMASAVRSLRRVSSIFEAAVGHFRLLETLTTRDYLAFRDQLIPASGFQSAQLREIEILLGLDDRLRVPLGSGGRPDAYKEALHGVDGAPSPALVRVEARLADVAPSDGGAGGPRTLRGVLRAWLARTPIPQGVDAFLEQVLGAHRAEVARRIAIAKDTPGVDETSLEQRYHAELSSVESFLSGSEDPSASEPEQLEKRQVRAGLIFLESYRELPRLAWPREVVDAVIEMEQAMVIWRQRHARMVERIIGRRVGTGGSAGVDYLDETARRYRVFSDLWAVRTLLLRKEAVMPMENADDYRFRVEDR